MAEIVIDMAEIKDMEKFLEENWGGKEPRKMTIHTGREGAILATIGQIIGFKEYAGETVTPEERAEIEKEVRSQHWEPGMYDISDGVEYIGLCDDKMKDGYFVVKREGKYYMEDWKNGFRRRFNIISEEKFNQLKAEHDKKNVNDTNTN